MAKKMLIDASHPEETRVAIVDQNQLEDLDVESQTKQTFKGNIYLAKVVRIEPSLQAAFVDYGGNRHGFLAFSEIHPDYYRIPIEDREALVATHKPGGEDADIFDELDVTPIEDLSELPPPPSDFEAASAAEIIPLDELESPVLDSFEEPRKSPRPPKSYKIQEVIKKRQILLVQVMKEERGGKGAALTTYLSLAGRYCVLMPNTDRGGGISRKITNTTDRKRLRSILDSLTIPKGMGIIVRTAGLERSKIEIKKDSEYLLRLWNDIREKTLESIAPAMIHAEGTLLKRALRDFYSKDIDDVFVQGEEAYKDAKTLMRMLMPSHAKKIQLYKDPLRSLFQKYEVESQIDALHNPTAQLPSGGYLVINPTEALVSIDVNSGRSTKERNVEETAYRTNLEAADEVARQLRLRDLAGLVVIDFIDMDDNKNNQAVERRLKEALRSDKARIQVGHISSFGLLELSRQRLRPSFIESNTTICLHCRGTGNIRATESTALHVLRLVQEEAMKGGLNELRVYLPSKVAFYLLNQKRTLLGELEVQFKLKISFECDDTLIAPDCRMERIKRPLNEDAPEEVTVVEILQEEALKPPLKTRSIEPKLQEAPSEPKKFGKKKRPPRLPKVLVVDETDIVIKGSPEYFEMMEAAAKELPISVDENAPLDSSDALEDDAAKKRRRGRRGGKSRGHPYTQRSADFREPKQENIAQETPSPTAPNHLHNVAVGDKKGWWQRLLD